MAAPNRRQARILSNLGYPHVVTCMSAAGEVAEGCGEGAHSSVWKVASENDPSKLAVAKFWDAAYGGFQKRQEDALRRAESKFVTCMPRVIASEQNCTLMTLCEGTTLHTFAESVAETPSRYTIRGLERVLEAFVHALNDLHAAGIYNDDMHDDNVLVDYGRKVVWVIDPYPTQKRNADTGVRIVKILSRCIALVAVAETSGIDDPAPGSVAEQLLGYRHEYVSWTSVSDTG